MNMKDKINAIQCCVHHGHTMKFSQLIKNGSYRGGDCYSEIIMVCSVCGFSENRHATRKELKALRVLGLRK